MSGDLRVLVSQDLRGQEAARRVFLEYSGKPVQTPQSRDQAPKAEFLAWHLENVFKKPHRALA